MEKLLDYEDNLKFIIRFYYNKFLKYLKYSQDKIYLYM